MGLFFYTKKGSIISTVDLPTTEIIEPKNIGGTKQRFIKFIQNLLRTQTVMELVI